MKELEEITGRTARRKNGLVISSDKDYFVKDMHNWEEKLFDKRVKAKGHISVRKNNALIPPSSEGIIAQGIRTHSWEEYHALDQQYWIEIKELEILEG